MKTTQKLLGYVLPYLLALTVTPGCGPDRQATAEQERKTEIAMKARALYEEKCKTVAKREIYRTVPDVEGIVLLKVRPVPGAKEWADLMWPGAVFADESYGDHYISTFLGYEYSSLPKGDWIKDRQLVPVSPTNRGYINTDRRPGGLAGYRYVDVIDEKDGKRYRYTARYDEPWRTDSSYSKSYVRFNLDKTPAPDPSPRYGVTFEDHVIPEERELGVASSTVKVIDLQSNEVLGELTRYAWGATKPSGANPSPWLTAKKCPSGDGIGVEATTRKFVDRRIQV
ncbi:MAG: hypothetical protein IPP84_05315 [Propionivibrio sp.]|uniref:hypothetical protein n=1 Tax=Propionivibrio sp. TaxID=2212460 RepID=UPI0025DCE57D|nr:hypothetical protein [Propionivibrio sp.]MBL0207397.1 hypothetical protein [Propionivibrio sp.]